MKKNKVPKMEYSGKEPSKFRANHKLKDRTVDGLVITDPMGQWAHPGQITRIPSNDITMQGVPYPVFGIDDTGHSQMMYPGADYTFPGQYVTEYPMAQKGKQVEDNDSWLENIAEIIDPTGISSWDDVYRAYKNTGLSKETALELLGAIPFLGKVKKAGRLVDDLTNAFAITKRQKNNAKITSGALKSIGKYGPSAGRVTDAVQAVLGSKDNSGFTWDMSHGESPQYDGRNIFPQIQLGEHGDFAYGGWLDEYDNGKLPKAQYGKGPHPEWYDNRVASGEKYPVAYKDIRKIPQSGIVVDKRTNMAYAVGDNGKTLAFNVLTGANPETNYHPYTIDQLAKNRKLRNTPVGYYNLDTQQTPVKGSHEDINYKSKIRNIDPIAAYGVPAPTAVNLAFHRLYADNAYDPNDVEYNKRLGLLRQSDPKLRCGSYGCVNVGDDSYDKVNKMFPKDDTLMIIDSKRPNDLKLLKQAKKRMKKEEGGDWLESYNDDEYKRGGQKRLKNFTSKNIQTSVNDLMMRNELLFGPSGKRRYKPDLKYNNGGSTNNWLDDI